MATEKQLAAYKKLADIIGVKYDLDKLATMDYAAYCLAHDALSVQYNEYIKNKKEQATATKAVTPTKETKKRNDFNGAQYGMCFRIANAKEGLDDSQIITETVRLYKLASAGEAQIRASSSFSEVLK